MLTNTARAGLGADGTSGDHRAKISAWRRQSGALAAPAYRVTVKGRTGDAEGKTINLGKSKIEGQPEKFYSATEVEALIPQLRRRNALGFDIYLTPIDPAAHYLVIDDMKTGAAQLLAGLGHAPCLVQSSSAGNEQAVLKVAKAGRPKDEQQLANKLVQRLNEAHGDPKFSGVVHPFRMAGFSNKKPGKGNAFTRILVAVPRLCTRADELLQRLRDESDELAVQAQERRRIAHDARRQRGPACDSEEFELAEVFGRNDGAARAFRSAAAQVRVWVQLRGLVEDASRVDYRAALSMLQAGWSDAAVRAGMLAGSNGLTQRHRDVDDYIHRTVARAGAEAARLEAATRASERMRAS
jgi:hypothetical protein